MRKVILEYGPQVIEEQSGKMDYPIELWILMGVGGAFTIFLIYYVIQLERKIVKVLQKNVSRIKRQNEMAKEVETEWDKKY
jgi:hypothetical protein